MFLVDMGKTELRAACKAAGIQYGKLTVGGMRDALRDTAVIEGWYSKDAAPVAPVTRNMEELGKFGLGTSEDDAVCPHCGINHIHNGMLTADDEAANSTKTLWESGQQNAEFSCMGCGGEWGVVREAYVAPKQVDRHNGTGLKIEKVREERNGVKRPSAGGKCRAVWDALDALQAELEAGELVTSSMVKDLAADEGWNPNNASIEFYQWRKFNGISKASK